MTYVDILIWAKKGIETEIYKQNQMLNDTRKLDTPQRACPERAFKPERE